MPFTFQHFYSNRNSTLRVLRTLVGSGSVLQIGWLKTHNGPPTADTLESKSCLSCLFSPQFVRAASARRAASMSVWVTLASLSLYGLDVLLLTEHNSAASTLIRTVVDQVTPVRLNPVQLYPILGVHLYSYLERDTSPRSTRLLGIRGDSQGTAWRWGTPWGRKPMSTEHRSPPDTPIPLDETGSAGKTSCLWSSGSRTRMRSR